MGQGWEHLTGHRWSRVASGVCCFLRSQNWLPKKPNWTGQISRVSDFGHPMLKYCFILFKIFLYYMQDLIRAYQAQLKNIGRHPELHFNSSLHAASRDSNFDGFPLWLRPDLQSVTPEGCQSSRAKLGVGELSCDGEAIESGTSVSCRACA